MKSTAHLNARGSIVVVVILTIVVIAVVLASGIVLTQGTKYEFTLTDITDSVAYVKGFIVGSTKDELDVTDGKLNPELFTASMRILDATDTTVTIRINVSSSAGGIKDMKVWTSANPPREWEPFKNVVTLKEADFVYARFRDYKNNVSDVFTQNVYVYKNAPTQ